MPVASLLTSYSGFGENVSGNYDAWLDIVDWELHCEFDSMAGSQRIHVFGHGDQAVDELGSWWLQTVAYTHKCGRTLYSSTPFF